MRHTWFKKILCGATALVTAASLVSLTPILRRQPPPLRHGRLQHQHDVVLQVRSDAHHLLGMGPGHIPSGGRLQPDPPEHLRGLRDQGRWFGRVHPATQRLEGQFGRS